MENTFHYPPELMNLLIDTIPLLFRSKKDVILFFYGCGVPYTLVDSLNATVERDRDSITKYEIARTVLAKINEQGDYTLGARREVLKRVTEFEDFSSCWPDDQLKAKGLVGEVRRVVNVKDSFTRMQLERDAERQKHQAEYVARAEKERQKREAVTEVRDRLCSLFAEKNPQKRGKALEGVLNKLFSIYGILIREAFTLVGQDGEGIVEQIDGVIELGGQIYLVEMKWWGEPIGVGDVSQHLVRVFGREGARGIFISASGFTSPAIVTCKESLPRVMMVLVDLQEIVFLLENNGDLSEFLRKKVQAVIVDKNPFSRE